MAEPRFVFRAAVVLELRRRADEDAQAALRAANSALEQAERELAAARAAVHEACRRPRGDTIAAEWYRNWMVGLRAAVARLTEQASLRRRAREEALARALTARQALRVIERLREKRLRAFELDRTRREQRRIDELAIGRHAAASGGSS